MSNYKSEMQHLIWSSIVAQMEKAKDTTSQYYNFAYSQMKFHEKRQTNA